MPLSSSLHHISSFSDFLRQASLDGLRPRGNMAAVSRRQARRRDNEGLEVESGIREGAEREHGYLGDSSSVIAN